MTFTRFLNNGLKIAKNSSMWMFLKCTRFNQVRLKKLQEILPQHCRIHHLFSRNDFLLNLLKKTTEESVPSRVGMFSQSRPIPKYSLSVGYFLFFRPFFTVHDSIFKLKFDPNTFLTCDYTTVVC